MPFRTNQMRTFRAECPLTDQRARMRKTWSPSCVHACAASCEPGDCCCTSDMNAAAAAAECGTSSCTADVSVLATLEKAPAMSSPRAWREDAMRGASGRWLMPGALETLAATLRLLERTTAGACPTLDEQVVFAPLYHSVSVPEISPAAYLEEYVLAQGLLQKEWMLEPMVLHTVVLIDRLLHAHSASGFHLCVSNAHRLLLVAALISSKSLDDETYNNTYWARIGGVSLEHLNELELYTCQALDWRLSVDATELQATKATLLAM